MMHERSIDSVAEMVVRRTLPELPCEGRPQRAPGFNDGAWTLRHLSYGNRANKLLKQTTGNFFMSDDLKNRGPQDRSRVNLNEKWEIRYWTKEFGGNEEQLREAVQKAGPSAEAVRRE